MGNEWGQFLEWKYNEGLEWKDLADDMNKKMQAFTIKMNALYKEETALWELEQDPQASVEFIDADNTKEVVLSFIRKGKRKKDFLIVLLNFTPEEQRNFRIKVPYKGTYEELLNTELAEYGGTWTKGQEPMVTTSEQDEHIIELIVPALGALILKPATITITRKK